MRKESRKGRRQRKEERKMGRKVRGEGGGMRGWRVKQKNRDEKSDVNLTKQIRIHHQISIIASIQKARIDIPVQAVCKMFLK